MSIVSCPITGKNDQERYPYTPASPPVQKMFLFRVMSFFRRTLGRSIQGYVVPCCKLNDWARAYEDGNDGACVPMYVPE